MMYLHKEGKVAEYEKAKKTSSGQYFDLVSRPKGWVWFSNQEFIVNGTNPDGWCESKEEAYKAAMDYHETEGCRLYLELYPAPEKSKWDWIAQDCNGHWYGYGAQPIAKFDGWANQDFGSHEIIFKSQPNPFWRKTLR